MSACQKWRDIMPHLDGSDERSQAELEQHLAVCPDCAAEYEQMAAFRRVIGGYARPQPDPEAWKRWDEQLERELDTIDRERKAGRHIRFHRQPGIRRFAAISAAAAVFLLGIATGRWLLPSLDDSDRVAEYAPETPSPTAVPDSRNYIDRSQVLLLGVTQTDPSRYDALSGSNLDRMKKIARDLLDEAPGLKRKLADRREYRMYALVNDLEVILLQIAAFDRENTREQLELVQDGVERKALLFKINIENLAAEAPEAGVSGSLPSEEFDRM